MRCGTCSRRRGRSRRGRLITVFGCGGDRDRTKRPLMGAVAGRLSDVIVITSDNPRSEDPDRIIEEIQRGITPDTRQDSAQRLLTIVDRREAIAKAIELARPGDLVLIAGKGHEKYQVIGDRTLPFDDVAVAREALVAPANQLGRRVGRERVGGAGDPADGGWVAAAMAGVIVSGDRAREFGGVSIDTRTLAAGELFVGIRGERFDGADFAAAAIERGRGGRRGAARLGTRGVERPDGRRRSRSTTRRWRCRRWRTRSGARRERRSWRSRAARARPRPRK